MEVQDDFERLAKKFGVPTRPDPSVISRRCWGCGDAFVSRDIQQRYCTQKCKAKNKPKVAWGKKSEKPVKVNYQRYIQSDEWKQKAEAAKKRAKYRCQVCNRGRDEVLQLEAHHRTYEYLGQERTEDITVLCDVCHDIFSKQGRLAKP